MEPRLVLQGPPDQVTDCTAELLALMTEVHNMKRPMTRKARRKLQRHDRETWTKVGKKWHRRRGV